MQLTDSDLFIFDWDGTLSTSTVIVRISNFLKPRYRKSHIMKNSGKYTADTTRNIKSIERENKVFSFLYDIYSFFVMPRLKEGTMELLDRLRSDGKKVAIFSDSENYRLLTEVKKLGVLGKVDLVLSASTIGYYKPDPAGLLLLSKKLNTATKKAVYVGDMPSDIMTAKFAGMRSCGLGDGLSPYASLKDSHPDFLFRNIRAMLREI